jgi:hypothetical protein
MLIHTTASKWRYGGKPIRGRYFGGLIIEDASICAGEFNLLKQRHEVVVFWDQYGRHPYTYFYLDGELCEDADALGFNRHESLSMMPHDPRVGRVDPATAPDWVNTVNDNGSQYRVVHRGFAYALGPWLNAVHTPDNETIPVTRINPFGDEYNLVFASDWSSVEFEQQGVKR